ncbi:MAG: hypothetical protein LBB45_00505 [Methanobrevibacter sp.]|jgi:hypothetical protein|nr:hypothetical protein [Candidatus Methanovirga basalitermitum]
MNQSEVKLTELTSTIAVLSFYDSDKYVDKILSLEKERDAIYDKLGGF